MFHKGLNLNPTDLLRHLHPELIPSLDRLPEDRPVSLFTRHSLREQPANDFAGREVPLTATGVALARAWGQSLGRPITRLVSSPVERCRKTAEAMAEGAGVTLPLATDKLLVEPGSYVRDLTRAGPHFSQLGALAFACRHLREGIPGVLSPTRGARRILQRLYQQQPQPGELAVYVTHDTILAALIYCLLQQQNLDQSDWPWMMEGAFLWFDEAEVHWIWRGRRGHRNWRQLD